MSKSFANFQFFSEKMKFFAVFTLSTLVPVEVFCTPILNTDVAQEEEGSSNSEYDYSSDTTTVVTTTATDTTIPIDTTTATDTTILLDTTTIVRSPHKKASF